MLIWCHKPQINIACALVIVHASCFSSSVMSEPAARARDHASVAVQTAAIAALPFTEILLQVDLNQQGLNETVLLIRTKEGDILLDGEDMARWRLVLPAQPTMRKDDKDYFSLQAMAGTQYSLDEGKQLLSIEFPAAAFKHFDIDRVAQPAALSASSKGLLFNYDLLAQRSDNGNQVAGYFEAGTATDFGVGLSTFVSTRLQDRQQAIRLDSRWTVDQPQSLASWRVGDAISRSASAWGRSVHFGGLQYASNFAVQPGLITMPQHAIAGQAVLPSTVDIFVNNALVQRTEVPPGPFSVNNIPVVTGSGDMRVVVRDVLGREQVVTSPFFASIKLLSSGLTDFSYEVGRQRENYALTSNDYGRWLAAGTYRQGISDSLTGEVHAEAMSENQKAVGLNGVLAMPAMSTVANASIALSTSRKGAGTLGSLGFEMQKKGYIVAGRTQFMSRNFSQIGLEPDQLPPRRLTNINVGYFSPLYGSFGAAYVKQDNRATDKNELLSLSYSTNLGNHAYLGLTLFKSFVNSSSNSVGAFLLIPLDQRTSASLNVQRAKGADAYSRINAQIQRSLDVESGYGYRVQSSNDGAHEAEVSVQNGMALGSVAMAMQGGRTATRANLSGSIVAIEGSFFASRRIDDSYALVQVPGFANVRVYADNQLAGRTDADGNVLIPRVRAYEKNAIGIESLDLPLSAKIDSLRLDAVPAYRSGVVLKFPVTHANGGTLRIVLADGSALPVGAQVRLNEQDEISPVGMGGEVYFTGLLERNMLRVTWRGKRCQISVSYTASSDPLPFLGSYTCEGVSR